MGCGCKKWAVTTFICNICGNEFIFKHRDGADKLVLAMRRNAKCTKCGSTDFRVKND